ncbi:MAG: extracellular solute-binding protein [Thermaceae bacterium]|nr:extracellular solute-binding protein [Thermaceae bacterium]
MKKKAVSALARAAVLLSVLSIGGVRAQSAVTLNFYSGGDVNVQDLWANNLIPMYKKVAPNVTINLVWSEHGAADQATFDRLAAAKKAGKVSGVDLWESGMVQQAGEAGMMAKIAASDVSNLSKVPPTIIQQVGSYGLPYRGSSVVLAYNSKEVSSPPRSLPELFDWIKKNPGKFTYNTPDTGGSGHAFVERVLMSGLPQDQIKTFQTEYKPEMVSAFDKGLATLKELDASMYQNGFHPKGNVGTLQLLAKGNIRMGTVWSDMALSYLAQNLLPPEIKLVQLEPPFSGGAAFLGVAADSPNKAQAMAFLNWLLTPEVQAVVINKMNGYPGVDWKYVPTETRTKFADIAKSYSIGFQERFGADINKLWYEKIAGTPMPASK